jgi:hypothetical protein
VWAKGLRIADLERLIAKEVRRVESRGRGQRALEVVLVVEVASADMIAAAQLVVDLDEVLRAVDIVVGAECDLAGRVGV